MKRWLVGLGALSMMGMGFGIEAAPGAAPGALQPEAAAKTLCQSMGGGCALVKIHPAGKNAAGAALSLIELSQNEGEAAELCNPHRRLFYLHESKGDKAELTWLLDLCNDGYGAAGVGEDLVVVSENKLSYSQNGGSNSRWSSETMVQLSPLRYLNEESCGFHTLRNESNGIWWDWQTFSGESQSQLPLCVEGSDDLKMALACQKGAQTHGYLPIPQWKLDKGIDFSSTQLGTCALEVNAADTRGYVVHGKNGAKGDSAMKVLMTDDKTLVIEVFDDLLVSGGKSWLYDDHLEIWVDDQNTYFECDKEKGGMQWGIRISDGKAFDGRKTRKLMPEVQRWDMRDGDRVIGARLQVKLPVKPNFITVVYSDSDDGKKQERLIATSRLNYAEVTSFGQSKRIKGEFAKCVQKGNILQVEAQDVPKRMDQASLEFN